ncbi:MAG: DUF805 domain-containing protein [Bacteroidales bacterium]|nr:DUF805 domain-containing protein [Bacteroidales bacterium]
MTEKVPNKPNESLFKSCFWEQITKHYCVFNGNVDRKTFWVCYLYWVLIMWVIGGVSVFFPLIGSALLLIVSLGLTLPFLGLMVRRLHDIGKKGTWLLISFVPIVGPIWFLVLMVQKGETQNPNKWNVKDMIITIAMLVVCIGLCVLGLSGITTNLADGISRKDNCQKIEMNNAENEIKVEIERQVLEAYKTHEIYNLETPDFKAVGDAASDAEDASGYLCIDWDYYYCTNEDPNLAKVVSVKSQIVQNDKAHVYVTLDYDWDDSKPETIVLVMVRDSKGQWLVDDVRTTGEYSDSIKELMIECANSDWGDERGDEIDDSDYENESTLDMEHVFYDDYYNPRFDFSVSYPTFFVRKYEAANQDGCEFAFGNNYSMRVYGMNNVLEKTIKELFKDSIKSTDTYSTSKDNWFVVSGVNEQGNIYYRKTILENNVEYVVELVYPRAHKTEYEAVVKKVISSFQVMGGEDEDRERYVVIDGSELRLRLGPSTSSETLKWEDGSNRHPEVGEVFRLLDESEDFYKIDYKGNEVWVSKQFSHIGQQ